jgi:hypothetical protein
MCRAPFVSPVLLNIILSLPPGGYAPKFFCCASGGGQSLQYIQRDGDKADGANACGGEKDSQRPRSNGSYPSGCLAGQRARACGSPSGPHCQSLPRRRSVEPPASGAAATTSRQGTGRTRRGGDGATAPIAKLRSGILRSADSSLCPPLRGQVSTPAPECTDPTPAGSTRSPPQSADTQALLSSAPSGCQRWQSTENAPLSQSSCSRG